MMGRPIMFHAAGLSLLEVSKRDTMYQWLPRESIRGWFHRFSVKREFRRALAED
jgi:hypothetical protein